MTRATPDPVARCGSREPGHDLHPREAHRAVEGEGEAVRARVTGEGWLELETGRGERSRWWNHDPDRLRRLLHAADGRAELCPHGVLAVPFEGGRDLLSLAPAPSPCPSRHPGASGR